MTHTGHPDGRPASVRAVSAPPEATPVDIPSPTQAASDSGAAGSTATGSGSFRNRERSEFEKILRSLASLKITVWLLAAGVFLVFAGTVAQTDAGIWTVVDEHFRSFWTSFEVRNLTFGVVDTPSWVRVPFPGGTLLGLALLVNILAAHAVRFKIKAKGARLQVGLVVLGVAVVFTWLVIRGMFQADVAATEGAASMRVAGRLIKGTLASLGLLAGCLMVFQRRAGIVLLHSGVILLILAEFYTTILAVESQMRLSEGDARNWVYDHRTNELAVVDPSDPNKDRVVVIPQSHLRRPGAVIEHPELPFDIEVLEFMRNSSLDDIGNHPGKPNPATKGAGLRWLAFPKDETAGTDRDQRVNVTSAYVRLLSKPEGRDLGAYLVSNLFTLPQTVSEAGRVYQLDLRFRRTYKPYTIELLDFRHERYIGTSTPKDFSSFIRLTDPSRDVDREVRIWMNNPLRYAGETFYQSSYDGEETTILQVVRNESWMVPYVACMIVLTGMMAHFGMTLKGALVRRKSS